MDDNIFEKCPYFDTGQCPQPEAVARAYLVPQLVGRSEVEATNRVCHSCGKYMDEKRKYPRVKRPLPIVLLKGEKTAIEGEIVDISAGGARIRLNKWIDFDEDGKATLEIDPSHADAERESLSTIKVTGLIKRIDEQEQQLAIAFLR
jgi:hypothetical protein